MNSPISWWWPVLAGVATAVALILGPDYAVAVPMATIAVVAAALTLLGPLRRRREERRSTSYAPPVHVGSVRGAFSAGQPGWEDIVLTLDLVERKVFRPDLPTRTGQQIGQILRQSRPEFREYVTRRLDELEGSS